MLPRVQTILFLFCCSCLGTSAQAQFEILDVNNIGFGVGYGGTLCNHDDVYYSLAPIEGTNHIIWGIAPLWSAYDDSGQVYGDILYINNAEDHAGPHADTALNLAQELALQRYKMVRKIERSEIEAFTSHFGEPGYTIPQIIRDWPGNGDTTLGTTFQLAPYVDHNANGIYEPDSGDYPLIKGDQAIFQLLHDRPTGSQATGGDPNFSMLEYRQMVYGYEALPGSLLDNAVFIDMQIINRSDRTYHDFVFGYLTFFELGFFGNNYMGSDSSVNLQYCYKGDTTDTGYGDWIYYGDLLPATGLQFMNVPMDVSMNPIGELSETWLQRFQFYQRAYWPFDTTHMTDGGSGYGTGSLTNYSYHDHPDDTDGWNEFTQGNPPGQRRAYSSTFFGDLHPGDTVCHTAAVLFAPGTIPNNRTAAVTDLINMASALQAQYPYLPDAGNCMQTRQDAPYWQTEVNPADGITFLPYPNPASDVVYLHTGPFKQSDVSLNLSDMNGKLIETWFLADLNSEQIISIRLPALTAGIYVLSGQANGFTFVKKIVIK